MKANHLGLQRQALNLILSALTLVTAIPAAADVRLPKIFTDNMVLQRDLPVRVWGWADAGEDVAVTLAGKSATTRANEKGQWSLELPAFKTGENLEIVAELKPEFIARQEAIKAFRAELPKALIQLEGWIAKTRKDLADGTETAGDQR